MAALALGGEQAAAAFADIDLLCDPERLLDGRLLRNGCHAAILHDAVPGRLRLHVPSLQRSERQKRVLEDTLAAEPFVRSTTASVWTGNALILFDPAVPREQVLAVVRRCLPNGMALNDDRDPAPPPPQPFLKKPAEPLARVEVPKPDRQQAPAAPPAQAEAPGHAPSSWHRRDVAAVVRETGADLRAGLSRQEAQERLQRDGANVLAHRPPRSELAIFTDQLISLPVALLAGSAAISLATGGLADAVVIGGVILLNALIGYGTERQAEGVINALDNDKSPPVRVLRGGAPVDVAAEQVVKGDLLLLEPGTLLAADARLVETSALSIDESMLTGESVPVAKSATTFDDPHLPLADRLNMAFRGTAVTSGSGRAIVVATGQHTEAGRIQTLLGEVAQPETPLQRQLHRIGRQLVWLCCGVCASIFVVGLLRGLGALPMLRTAVSLAVAALPEGLPAIATTTLALGIGRMRRHQVLVRRLQAIETLGAVQSLCFDKTGTLTLNCMSVTSAALGARIVHVEPGTPLVRTAELGPEWGAHLEKLLQLAVLCNETQLDGENRDDLVLDGSPTERALIEFARANGVEPLGLRREHGLARTEPRSETRPWMVTWHGLNGSGHLAAVKGNPIAVLGLCRRYLDAGRERPLDEEMRRRIEGANASMQTEGLRVLGFAYQHAAAPGEIAPGDADLVWVGLTGMADPIRPGMKELMQVFHSAGIKTVMITGDQSGTAYAIAHELGLGSGADGDIEILESSHLDRLEPEVLRAMAARADVFARVSPTHKLQIVQAMQQGGRVVAMTGDGVNDGPALKAAEVGVAMGKGGTEVARSVADIVLAEDDLATMATAVAEGRTIYNNIRKSIHYLLATNLSEVVVTGGGVVFGSGELLSPIQLLWINLVSDVFPAVALALEPPEPDILRRPPRDPAAPILEARDFKRFAHEALLLSAGALGAYLVGRGLHGAGPRANTMVFHTVTTAQLIQALSCRSERHGLFTRERLAGNPYLRAAVPASLALQAGTLLLPGLRRLLSLGALGLLDVGVVAAGAVLPLLANELMKVGAPEAAA